MTMTTSCLKELNSTNFTKIAKQTRGREGLTQHLHSEAPAGNRRMAVTSARLKLIALLRCIGLARLDAPLVMFQLSVRIYFSHCIIIECQDHLLYPLLVGVLEDFVSVQTIKHECKR